MGLPEITWSVLLITGVLIYGSHSVLLNLCKIDGQIPFHSASVVVMIEASKLVLSLVMYLAGETHSDGQRAPWSLVSSLLYAIPAMLYGINNNIFVHAQEHMDPASSQVLSNVKIVTTAVLYRLVIRKRLSWRQWFAVGLLALAGMCYGGVEVQQSVSGEYDVREPFVTVTGILLMLVYCIVSGTAGVYTEYILKRHSQTSLHVQNIQLYMYGVSLNMLAFCYSTWGWNHTAKRFFYGYSLWTLVIIVSQAMIGLIMSVIMKHGSNILRLFVIASAMVVNTALSVAVFALRPTLNFWLAFAMVLLALYLYYQKQSIFSLTGKTFPVLKVIYNICKHQKNQTTELL